MDKRAKFYTRAINEWISDKDATILIIAGGQNDYQVFKTLEYNNVLITNLDSRLDQDSFPLYDFELQNAESLTYHDSAFVYVVVNASLHHCSSPHKSLIEMYRVARKGVIAIESRDSFLMKLLVKVGLVEQYETRAVYDNDFKYGGVNCSEIPNYAYRWTENEIEKTIKAFMPIGEHNFFFKYGNEKDFNKIKKINRPILIVLNLIKILYKVFILIFPKQQNLFAFCIIKPDLVNKLHPWLKYKNRKVKLNKSWLEKYYETSK